MSETAKHTMGPWFVDLNDGRFIVRDSNDDVVADCWNGTISDEGETPLDTCEPNARLIAAAPELLAALREAYDFLSSHYQNLSTGNWHDDDAALVASGVLSAIAKAEDR